MMGWHEVFLAVNLTLQLFFVGMWPMTMISDIDEKFDEKQTKNDMSLHERLHIEDNRSLIKQYSISIVYGIMMYLMVIMWAVFKGHKSVIMTYTTLNAVLCASFLWYLLWSAPSKTDDILQALTWILYFAIVSFYAYKVAQNAAKRKQRRISAQNTLTIRYQRPNTATATATTAGSKDEVLKDEASWATIDKENSTYAPNLETKLLMDPKSYV